MNDVLSIDNDSNVSNVSIFGVVSYVVTGFMYFSGFSFGIGRNVSGMFIGFLYFDSIGGVVRVVVSGFNGGAVRDVEGVYRFYISFYSCCRLFLFYVCGL